MQIESHHTAAAAPSAVAPPAADPPAISPAWAAAHALHYQFLTNQQTMLEDMHRTSKYHRAVMENAGDFAGKTVLDVGAGTGILSLFAAQAGASRVIAVEGTSAARYAQRLVDHAGLNHRIEVLHSPLDALKLDTKVDVIISEPWGFFLFHERMVEVFLIARDRHLIEGGRLFPSAARLWLAPFQDEVLYSWRSEQASFWERTDFFGVDLSGLATMARRELFEMPAIGLVEPSSLLAEPSGTDFDFERMALGELACIQLPFDFSISEAGRMHGIAGWFDVVFAGSSRTLTLSTSPSSAPTHWAQTRLLFPEPIEVERGDRMKGTLTLRANANSSYDAFLEAVTPSRSSGIRQAYRLEAYFSWQEAD